MLAEERRRKILELTQRDGRVVVKDLARRFSTSLITIRKDLESLHQMGRLQRAHGGALPIDATALRDPTLHEKEQLHRREKLKIAAAAARLVRPGHVVILDSGTTTTAIARAIKHIRDLTVITNAVNIAAELAGTDVEVILTGGVLRRNSFPWWVPSPKIPCGTSPPIFCSSPWTDSILSTGLLLLICSKRARIAS